VVAEEVWASLLEQQLAWQARAWPVWQEVGSQVSLRAAWQASQEGASQALPSLARERVPSASVG